MVKLDKKVIEEAAGLWKDFKETGVEYERRVRAGWGRRFKREMR